MGLIASEEKPGTAGGLRRVILTEMHAVAEE